MARLCIRGGRVIDPANRLDAPMDLVVRRGRIETLCRPGAAAGRPGAADRVIDARGLWVVPGLIDLHVHLRQPGMGRAETVATGTRAAAAGGFTRLVCMPNTRPALDHPRVVRKLARLVGKDALVEVHMAAALSVGLAGRRSTDLEALLQAGASCWSDDGAGTARADVLARALSASARLGPAVMVHAEDRRLTAGGVMRKGPIARRLGLAGISPASERVRVERDIGLAARTGGRLHLQHLSTIGALSAVRRAKRRGLAVTCEVTPHHLILCDEDLEASCGPRGPDPNFKMNPPLGTRIERDALRAALVDGTVDALATDHAPHTRVSKARGFEQAPFGVIGLETALPLILRLVEQGLIDRSRAIALMTSGPAGVIDCGAGRLETGGRADITLVDPKLRYLLEPRRLRSRAANTPFAGWTMTGRAVSTLVAGKQVHRLRAQAAATRTHR
jgi:dihydroorotase